MNFVITIVSIVILITGIVLKHNEKVVNYQEVSSVTEVLSGKDIKDGNNLEVSDDEEKPTSTVSPSPTPKLTPTNNPTPQATNIPSKEFIYPNSKIIKSDGGNFLLESTDHPDTITNWYQNLIKSMKMNINTFIKNTVNDKVQNKLVGAGSNFKITIDIEKLPGEEITTVKITY